MGAKHCELFQVMKVVGEKEIQVVERTACAVPGCAAPVHKIIDVTAETGETRDSVFINKVVKEGVLQVGILFAGGDELVRYVSAEVPFIAEAEIIGARPGMDAHNKLISIEQTVDIITENPGNEFICQVFDIRIVARFLIRVTTTVERHLVKCQPRKPCGGWSCTRSGSYSTEHF